MKKKLTKRSKNILKYSDQLSCSKTFDMERFISTFRKVKMSSVEKFTDIKIKCGPSEYHCHKVILAANSPVFRTMFQSDMLEKATGEVNMMDVHPEVVKMMLEWMYHGDIDRRTKDDTISDLHDLAEMYLMKDLKDLCLDILSLN